MAVDVGPLAKERSGRVSEEGECEDLHGADGSIDRGAPELDGDDGVEDLHRGLERLQEVVLVREPAEAAGLDTEADAALDVLLLGLEPGQRSEDKRTCKVDERAYQASS
jgi:hypothetical protein